MTSTRTPTVTQTQTRTKATARTHATRPVTSLLFALSALVAGASPGLAQTPAPDLGQMSIEDLMNIEITSASRKEQRVADVAAAVFVITRDDIRRSGMTTLPDLLRLAPGVDVAQINSNKFAVSVRGFNGLYANKLLVLIDGRRIYNWLYSGVIWDGQDPMLDDIDRIEVIRGPGATMWGANAVNGVINIVTKATAETKGGLVRVDVGNIGNQGAVRYGGALGSANYRLFLQWTGRDHSLLAPDVPANDASHSVTTGFRADWTARPGSFTLEGAYTTGEARALWLNLDSQTAALAPISHVPSEGYGGHLLGRWTQTRQSGASLQVQSSIDIVDRKEPIGDYNRRAFDFDAQYHTALGGRQDLVAGGGYQFIREGLAGHGGLSLTPAIDNSSLLTAFIQDEIAFFAKRVVVTLGTQVQYDSIEGGGVQPSARVIWKASPHQRLWAAASRALRTPSLGDRGIRVDYPPIPGPGGLPVVVTILGDPDTKTENHIDAEVGYRIEIGRAASIDVTAFAGRYDHLVTQEQSAPIVQFAPAPHILVVSQFSSDYLEATTRGLEIAGHWRPIPAWRLDGSYSAFRFTPTLAAASLDTGAARADGSAPQTQWQLRSAFTPGPRATFDVAVFHVGPLEQLQVEGYTRADVTAEWRFTSRLSAMAIGQNLFDAAHAEFAGAGSVLLATQVRRSASLRLKWTF